MYAATSAKASSRFGQMCFLIRSFFILLKKDSATALMLLCVSISVVEAVVAPENRCACDDLAHWPKNRKDASATARRRSPTVRGLHRDCPRDSGDDGAGDRTTRRPARHRRVPRTSARCGAAQDYRQRRPAGPPRLPDRFPVDPIVMAHTPERAAQAVRSAM